MSFSFRRSNAKQTTTDIAEDEQSDRWQFGFSGINFEEDEFEFENAPDWPEEIERSEEVSAQHSPEQLEFKTESVKVIKQVSIEEESPRPVAIELVNVMELEQEDDDRRLIERRAAAKAVIVSVQDDQIEEPEELIEEVVIKKSPVISAVVEPEPEIEAAVEPVAQNFQENSYQSSRQILPSDPALSFEQNLRRRFGGHVRSALGPGTVIEGKFRFDEPVRIEGSLSGEVKSSSALIVGSEAVVEGRINVGVLIVMGEVSGPIIAEDLVEIKKGAKVRGDITTQRIAIEEGAIFDGEVVTRG